ncbi:hypothetical protein HOG17_01255 [Candidatus Peregrinibacteria bacterium]|jgi:methionine-gamma-lyase|nr:hypothetical protein [Candidatus Peregrinibacteria bacterium]MBT4147952.1 hypothetical protein [Candidatus Peregrinibacteria bacterium]MBT4366297.1 hypothetical protein [Candidatus Peregrinibacteria bacterium]MBT4456172.1 hypothetical protein [Candidatus Peregrinibacteria bacterium]
MHQASLDLTQDPGFGEYVNAPLNSEMIEMADDAVVISRALGEQLVTQAFPDAKTLARAFHLELSELPPEYDEYVNKLVLSVREQMSEVVADYDIPDEALARVLKKVWVYARFSNPKIEFLEDVISEMEGTEKTAVFATGLAAIKAVTHQYTNPEMMKMAKGGEEELVKRSKVAEWQKDGYEVVGEEPAEKITVIGSIYGGTYAQLLDTWDQTDREVEFISLDEFMSGGLPVGTKMVYFESSNNPTLDVMPIDLIVAAAKEAGAVTVCDNTFTPISVKPAELGVDFVVYSMTKYIGGESKDMGGSVSGDADKIAMLSDMNIGQRMTGGGNMAARVAEIFLESIKDLPERLYKCNYNAKKLCRIACDYELDFNFIEKEGPKHKEVFDRIRNPLVPETVSNGMVTIDFGSQERAQEFVDKMINTGVGVGAVSLGATQSYYSIPAETTHSEIPSEKQLEMGVTPGMVRISCGVEANLVEAIEGVLEEMGL